ncbi:hypothetical protein NLI96_g9393 [Meripilus lineatus]|uniref:DUF6534 domain-containing protein n=1 Tax=Meripilus lineatus TaxID=2056292 RepID=A0AAD5YF90_9APHY|nr:hypothetical protein NLI96_g9393 [Physisporinus lineatus]
MYWIYDVLVNNFANEEALAKANWVFATDPAMVGIIATAVQLFFAWRVKVLTDNIWAVIFIVLTSLCSVLGGIGTAIGIHIVPEFVEFQKFKVVVIVWLIGAAVCDAAITLSLTWYLRRHKTGFSNTDVTVQNGLITAVWAIIDLIVYLASSTGLHLAFNFPLSKLYTNSLLSSLNSRAGWKFQSSESTGQKNIQLSEGFNRGRDVLSLTTTTRPEVFINVESHEMVDTTDSKGDVKWARHSTKDPMGSVADSV